MERKEFATVEFFDSYSFDRKLSTEIREKTTEIEVKVINPFDLNGMPDRLNKWLFKIDESGGTVKASALPPKSQIATRGIIGAVIDLAIAVFNIAKEAVLYAPAESYHANVLYRQDTGKVEKVIFSIR